jgi:hypothetical protein
MRMPDRKDPNKDKNMGMEIASNRVKVNGRRDVISKKMIFQPERPMAAVMASSRDKKVEPAVSIEKIENVNSPVANRKIKTNTSLSS